MRDALIGRPLERLVRCVFDFITPFTCAQPGMKCEARLLDFQIAAALCFQHEASNARHHPPRTRRRYAEMATGPNKITVLPHPSHFHEISVMVGTREDRATKPPVSRPLGAESWGRIRTRTFTRVSPDSGPRGNESLNRHSTQSHLAGLGVTNQTRSRQSPAWIKYISLCERVPVAPLRAGCV